MQYKIDPEDALAGPSFRGLYLLTALVGGLVAADVLFWSLGYEGLRSPWGWNLSLIAAVVGGARIVFGALSALLEGDVGADLALAIAMLAALLLKEYWVGAEVVLIAMIGESLEGLTFARTHREIERILELRPRQVRVRRGEELVEISAEEVRVGDTVVIRPGERIPVDGAVLAGRSTVDQSTLTGESLPVDKGPDDKLFAGTLNQFGALDVRADAVGEHTTLGQVIELVAQAQLRKARVERIADRLARYFLPFVLTCAALTFVAGNYDRLRAGDWSTAGNWQWMPTLAVLVVACPCSLILATPAAVMAAQAWLARRGVLVKGGLALERLAGVTRLAFDKTGTLTAGKLELGDCLAVSGVEPDDVLRWAAAAEQGSEHLIARAIVAAAAQRQLPRVVVEQFTALPGAGVSARVAPAASIQPVQLLVGNRRLMIEQGKTVSAEVDAAIQRLESTGQTALLVCVDDQILGALGVRDTLRPEAAQVVADLHACGLEEIVLLTGDRQAAAASVAAAVGIDRFESELRPEEKARWLAAWQRSGRQHQRDFSVAMVGDGVNDAPALASADVGVALAGVGSDLAAEAGDVILLGEPLTPLPSLVLLARQTVRVIHQNILLFAFFVNFLGIALTAWIMPSWSEAWLQRSPVAAAIFHQAGSVLVLLNAMRLLWFQRWHESFLGRLENWLAGVVGRGLEVFTPVGTAARWVLYYRRPLAKGAVVLALGAYLSQVVVFVQPDEVALVRRFGRHFAVHGPGPHLRLPPPWDLVTKEQPARVRTLEIGLRSVRQEQSSTAPIEWSSSHDEDTFRRLEDQATLLTGDQSLVELGATVQYRVCDLPAFRFGVREPERLLAALAEGVIREVIATRPLLDENSPTSAAAEILTTGRDDLEAAIARQLQSRADELGLGIEVLDEGVCLEDLHPPLPVVDAFRDVSRAFKEKERMRNEADAFRRERVILAAGSQAWQRLSTTEEALSEPLWAELRGDLGGEAATELAAARSFAATQEELSTGDAASFLLTEAAHRAAPELSRWRLLSDTLSAALAGKKKLLLDTPAGQRRHLLFGTPPGAALPAWLNEPPQAPEPER